MMIGPLPKQALIGMTGRQTRAVVILGRRQLSRTTATTNTKKASLIITTIRSNTTQMQNNQQQQQRRSLHASAKQQQPTPGLSVEQPVASALKQAASSASESAASSSVPKPTKEQLKILFTASAIPMVGFGFMDNIVMIQAGQLIDNSIGVTMGLATMTAAAAGQVVSDVSGVIFGGSLERFLQRYKLIEASSLTTAQRTLPLCRNVAMLGAVCGVALGCGLGASCLLFMDLEARERAERAIQLQAVMNDMMMEASDATDDNDGDEEGNGGGTLRFCETCTIHLAHVPTAEQFSTHHHKLQDGKTKIDFLPANLKEISSSAAVAKAGLSSGSSSSMVVRAAQTGESLQSDDGSVLCTPILSKENVGQVVAVLEFRNKKKIVAGSATDATADENDNIADQGFTLEDDKSAKVMARHIAIFMHRLGRE